METHTGNKKKQSNWLNTKLTETKRWCPKTTVSKVFTTAPKYYTFNSNVLSLTTSYSKTKEREEKLIFCLYNTEANTASHKYQLPNPPATIIKSAHFSVVGQRSLNVSQHFWFLAADIQQRIKIPTVQNWSLFNLSSFHRKGH